MVNVDALVAEYGGIRLDIGCGANKQAGWVGMDWQELPGVDIIHDVESYPWPLPDESVLVAFASHLVEHINPARGGFLKFMDEVWRVLRPGGEFAIATPHGYSPGYLQDPTHCNPCNEHTWYYFDPYPGEDHGGGLLYSFYKPKPWKLKHINYDPTANIEVVMIKRSLNGTQ